jgi:hypothetical protein
VNPVLVTGGQGSTGTVMLTSAAPSGGISVSLSSNNAAAQVQLSVIVPANAASAMFNITTSTVSASTPVTISATANGVTQTRNMTVTPTAALQAIGVNPATITGGQGSTGTVSLSSAAPVGGVLLSLSSNNAAAQVQSSVTVPANVASATFSVTTSAVSAPTPVTISATANGVTKATTLTLGGSGPGNPTYALSVSISSDRSSATWLQGSALSGLAYVFTSFASQLTNFNPTGITTVSYWLDNPAMTGSPTHTASAIPYDFVGTASNNFGNPWDTTTVAEGTHTITQQVTASNGSTEVDTATFTVQNKLSTALGTGRYEYVLPDQNMYVYSLDNNFQLVKHVSIPQTKAIRGVGEVPSTHMLYISYGGDGGGNGTGSLLKYDLLTDTIVWTQNYSHGIDSFTITPDGSKIYMPDGVNSGDGIWYVVDALTGNEIGSINTGTNGPHNTVASLDGAYVYGGPRYSSVLVEMSTATNAVALDIGPLNPSVRPFTINGKHTLAFTTASNASGIGFQVSDTITGKVLYTLSVPGFTIPSGFAGDSPNHGITLSPDEKEIYLVDAANAYLHVYDVTGLPTSAPLLVINIPLNTNFGGLESPCVYDCVRESWVRHTRDGHYIIVGDSGDVVDTTINQVVNRIPALLNTHRGFLEIDWQNGIPVSTTTRYGLGYVTQ